MEEPTLFTNEDTALEKQPETATEAVQKFRSYDAIIEKASKHYMSLKVNGIDDKEGLKIVTEARKEVKKARVSVGHKKEELNAGALAWQRMVNAEANRIVGLLSPIEDYLESQEKSIEAEKERIRQENEKIAKERIATRKRILIENLMKFDGVSYSLGSVSVHEDDVVGMSDFAFEKFAFEELAPEVEKEKSRLAEEKRLQEQAEALRKKQEEEAEVIRKQKEAEAEQERIRLQKIAEEQAEEKKKIELMQAELQAEKNRIEQEKIAEQKRKDDEAKAKKEAGERAILEAKQKAAYEQELKRIAELKERLKPNKQKLIDFAEQIKALQVPELSPELNEASKEIRVKLNSVYSYVKQQSELL